MHRGQWLVAAALLTIALAGWTQDTRGPVFTTEPAVEANRNPAAPLAAVVRFAASEPGETTIVRPFEKPAAIAHTVPARVVWELTVTGKPGSNVGWTLFGCQRVTGFLPFQASGAER